MDKKSFLTELEKTLRMQNIADIESILEEYEEHFKFKIADGYSEEEVAARLGSPTDLARQYSPAEKPQRTAGKAVVVAGLVLAGILVTMLFILFFGWVAVLGALTVACATLGVCLIGHLDILSLLPNIPNPGSAIMGRRQSGPGCSGWPGNLLLLALCPSIGQSIYSLAQALSGCRSGEAALAANCQNAAIQTEAQKKTSSGHWACISRVWHRFRPGFHRDGFAGRVV